MPKQAYTTKLKNKATIQQKLISFAVFSRNFLYLSKREQDRYRLLGLPRFRDWQIDDGWFVYLGRQVVDISSQPQLVGRQVDFGSQTQVGGKQLDIGRQVGRQTQVSSRYLLNKANTGSWVCSNYIFREWKRQINRLTDKNRHRQVGRDWQVGLNRQICSNRWVRRHMQVEVARQTQVGTNRLVGENRTFIKN